MKIETKTKILLCVMAGIMVVILVLLFSNKTSDQGTTAPIVIKQNPVLGTTPKDQEENVPVNTSIQIEFTKELESKNVELVASPHADFNLVIEKNRVTAKLKNPLLEGTTYNIEVFLDGKKVHTFSFSTIKPITYSPEFQKEAQLQTELDFEYSKEIEKLYQEYPMLNLLPIEGEGFEVVYDIGKKQYRIHINLPSTTDEETIKPFVEKALKKLRELGINPKENEYYLWVEKFD